MLNEIGLAARRHNGFCHSFACNSVTVGDENMRPFAGQKFGMGFAHPHCAARHQGDFTRYTSHRLSP